MKPSKFPRGPGEAPEEARSELGVPTEIAERVLGHRSTLVHGLLVGGATLRAQHRAHAPGRGLKEVGEHLDLYRELGQGGKLVALRPGRGEQQAC